MLTTEIITHSLSEQSKHGHNRFLNLRMSSKEDLPTHASLHSSPNSRAKSRRVHQGTHPNITQPAFPSLLPVTPSRKANRITAS